MRVLVTVNKYVFLTEEIKPGFFTYSKIVINAHESDRALGVLLEP